MTQSANADRPIITREVAREQGLKRYFIGEPCPLGHVVERWVSNGQCVECNYVLRKARGEAAREKGLKRYFTGKPCKHGHVAERFVLSRVCVECARMKMRKAREANPDKENERGRKWRAANSERWRRYRRKLATKPLGQLRLACERTAARLELGSLDDSRLKLLGYGPAKYIDHLESTLPVGMTVAEARKAGYHVDHVVPLAVISDALPLDEAGRIRAFRIASDLDNLRLIPGVENLHKNASFDGSDQIHFFEVLFARYPAPMQMAA